MKVSSMPTENGRPALTPPSGSGERDFVSYMGTKVRKLRKEKHLTQLDLARQVGITNGQISTIERGVSSPSISTLHKIARSLGVPMAEFFQDASDQQVRVTPASAGRRVARAGSTWVDLLTQSSGRDALSGYLVEIHHEDLRINTRPGTGEEYFLYVLGGTCSLGVDGQNVPLEPGDSAYVTAHKEQWIRNTGAEPFRALIVSPSSLINTEIKPPLAKTNR